jgi:hypothetical protein
VKEHLLACEPGQLRKEIRLEVVLSLQLPQGVASSSLVPTAVGLRRCMSARLFAITNFY